MSVIHGGGTSNALDMGFQPATVPSSARVVERKYCERCGATFWRDVPMLAKLGERECGRCRKTAIGDQRSAIEIDRSLRIAKGLRPAAQKRGVPDVVRAHSFPERSRFLRKAYVSQGAARAARMGAS